MGQRRLSELIQAEVDHVVEQGRLAYEQQVQVLMATETAKAVETDLQARRDVPSVMASLSDEAIKAYARLASLNNCPPKVSFILEGGRAILMSKSEAVQLPHGSKLHPAKSREYLGEFWEFSPAFNTKSSVDAFYGPEATSRMHELEREGIVVAVAEDAADKVRWLTVDFSKVFEERLVKLDAEAQANLPPSRLPSLRDFVIMGAWTLAGVVFLAVEVWFCGRLAETLLTPLHAEAWVITTAHVAASALVALGLIVSAGEIGYWDWFHELIVHVRGLERDVRASRRAGRLVYRKRKPTKPA